MSKYIRKTNFNIEKKNDTNESPNKYLWQIYLNIRIYSSHSDLVSSYIYGIGDLWFLQIWCSVPPLWQDMLYHGKQSWHAQSRHCHLPWKPPTTSQQHGSVDKRVGSTVHSVGDPLWGDMVTPPSIVGKDFIGSPATHKSDKHSVFCTLGSLRPPNTPLTLPDNPWHSPDTPQQ